MESEGNSISLSLQQEFQTPLGGNSFFFHSPSFVQKKNLDNFCFTLHGASSELLGRIFFNKKAYTAVSLPASSFGSFDLIQSVKREHLVIFVDMILEKLAKSGYQAVKITSFPECYNARHYNLVYDVLTQFDFKITQEHVNHYLRLKSEDFRDIVKPDERRYLNKAREGGFIFNELDTEHLPEAYELILSCRKDKGYDISMTYDEVNQAILDFPDRYLIFGLFLDNQLIAASICVKVNERILYDFYHGDHLAFRKYSPVVPLIQGIYSYARKHQFHLLDMGTSIEEGVYKFKKNLGAMNSRKTIFERAI